MRKKKVLFHSNHSKAYTGFGKNAQNLLKYLTEKGKYDIVELSNGRPLSDPQLQTLPWKALGTLPDDPAVIQQINQDPDRGRKAGYGAEMIDHIIAQEKPDIYIGAEDIWAFSDYYDKYWWNKINCMIWTTLDSLPILPEAVNCAPKVKNYYVWASFAEKAMAKLGHSHVKTLRGSISCDHFFPLKVDDRATLRKRFGIPADNFLIGFVFRNQLRKSVPNLLDGFKLFCDRNPEAKARLLLHTHWSEGWDIPRFLNEKGIDPQLVLTTYFCKSCQQYEIKPFTGQQQNCRFCGAQGSQETTSVMHGVNEQQLNEIYNLMDVYCHPFTSGGQEIPIQEAKLTELITLVTKYSCGEDNCTHESGGLPLEWSEYREPGTQFIKASTLPQSINKQLTKVWKMNKAKRAEIGKRARQFVKDNFSVEAIGQQLEKILDEMPLIEDFDFKKPDANTAYLPKDIPSDSDWVIDLYKNILHREVDVNYQGYQHWMQRLQTDLNRQQVYEAFIKAAHEENGKSQQFKIQDHLTDEPKDRRLIIVVRNGVREALYCLSLLPSLHEKHPNHKIYFATTPVLEELTHDNPYIHKIIPYNEAMNNALYLEGLGEHEGFFDMAFIPENCVDLKAIGHHNGSF